MLSKSKSVDVAQSKQAELRNRREEIREKLNKLTKPIDQLLPLTELSLSELSDRLKNQSLSPSDVLHAFQARTLQLYDKGNSGLCEFIREAESQAENMNTSAQTKSPLYGIPVSIKELCSVSGYDSTFGLWKRCNQPCPEDCVIVKVLREAGAIPFVLTSTSQLALTTSGYNPVFGNLHNPHSENHEPGGSSSGEAVLISQRGSPIGIGTDLAGSIRIPSAFCGLAGLKPTANRLSDLGMCHILRNAGVELKVVAGPIGKCVEDLANMMRTLLCPSMFRLDPTVPVMPFNEELYKGPLQKKLKIGYYETFDDPNIVQAVPSVRRAVREAVAILRRAGHEVSEFHVPDAFEALLLSLGAISIDGGELARQHLSDEPLNEYTKLMKQIASIPDAFRPMVDTGVKKFIGAPAAMSRHVRKRANVKELVDFIDEIRLYREKFAKAWFDSGELDALICPVWACPAQDKETMPHYNNPCVAYTLLFNLVNYPSGALPMGKVTDDDLESSKQLATQFKQNADIYHEKIMNLQDNTKGLPLSVQVVAKPWREEMVLRVMKELESGLVQ